MKTFNKYNPPKRLKISELTLPEDSSFMIDVPFNGLLSRRLQNFNQYSRAQLAEYQAHMLKNWGDIVLTLSGSNDYHARYVARYNSKFRKYLKNNQIGIAQSLATIGNND